MNNEIFMGIKSYNDKILYFHATLFIKLLRKSHFSSCYKPYYPIINYDSKNNLGVTRKPFLYDTN